MKVKVHWQSEMTAYFSTSFEAHSEEEAEQRVRNSVKNESWYSVELEIPSGSILKDNKTIKIV